MVQSDPPQPPALLPVASAPQAAPHLEAPHLDAPPIPQWQRQLVVKADHFVYWLTRHWLLSINLFFLLFAAGAVLSPILRATGHDRLGLLLFHLYGYTCHQMPSRSFFILGRQIAVCQRDLPLYGSLGMGGIVYALTGRRFSIRSSRLYLWVFVAPLAIDGTTQLLGLRESNWQLRVITGVLLGVGTVFYAYPYMNKAMNDTRDELAQRFGPNLERLRD